jgi:ATP-binding cassette subfamily B multidrug efflux pump
LRHIARYLKPYTFLIVLTISFVAVQSVLNLYLPDLMSNIVNRGIVRKDTDYIWREGFWMLAVSLVGVFSAILAAYTSAKASAGFSKDLRNAIFEKVQGFSVIETEKFGTSSLVTRTTNDVMQLQQTLVMTLRMVTMAPIMGIGGAIMAFSKDVKLSMILLVSVPALIGGIYLIIRFVTPLFRSLQRKIDSLNRVVREIVTGVRVIRAFNKDEKWKEKFKDVNIDLMETAIKVFRIISAVFPLLLFVMNMTTIAVIWIGAKRVDAGAVQVGDMMAVMQYVIQILFSFIMVSIIFVFLPRAQVSAERISEVLKTSPKIEEPKDPIGKAVDEGVVEFRNVTFRFPGAPEPVLRNISFTAKPGEITAIIGNTGSGKTTILNLIMRFYDPEEGGVYIDGVDVRRYRLKTLRRSIGYATQKPVIFQGTIRENIRFGRDIPDERVEKAAEIAQVMEFASKMEKGLDTEISEGGTDLSGGQKQRISLARAIAGECKIYLFDDTFSSLDFKTDAKIRSRLPEITKDAAVIVVAQRVSTVMNADKIIVLKDGKIEGIGKHSELYKTCPVYRDIVLSQLSEEEIEAI